MTKRKETERLKVLYDRGICTIYISLHSNNAYIGTVLYYEKNGNWNDKKEMILNYDLHQDYDQSKKNLREKLLAWIDENLGEVEQLSDIEEYS